MKMGPWQISTLALGMLWLGNVAGRGLTSPAEAAPSDVVGSPNVAVTGFKTAGGSFTLWADGHITNVPASSSEAITTVNPDARTTGAYTAAPAYMIPAAASGRPKGSPNVAVGVLPTRTATYVLFADGTPRLPSNDRARKGMGDTKVRYAIVNGLTNSIIEGDGSIRFGGSHGEGTNPLVFDPPFSRPPAVVTSSIESRYWASAGRIYPDRCEVLTGYTYNANFIPSNTIFSVIVTGE